MRIEKMKSVALGFLLCVADFIGGRVGLHGPDCWLTWPVIKMDVLRDPLVEKQVILRLQYRNLVIHPQGEIRTHYNLEITNPRKIYPMHFVLTKYEMCFSSKLISGLAILISSTNRPVKLLILE